MEFENLLGKEIGTYKIVELLGHGGQGYVFKAFDTFLKRFVVIKFFRTEEDDEAEDEMSFLVEARSLSRLNHPNIATIYTAGYYENYPYIVLEWISGKSLKEILKKEGQLNPERAKEIILQVAKALDYAHKKGFIHRDIKPSNIMISEENIPKILDFGLVKITGDTLRKKLGITDSTSESIVGTTFYMSPEVIRNEDIDRRSDLFSLGVVFYELITGKKPFDRGNYISTMMAITNDEPDDHLEKVECPIEIKNVIYKLLEKDPKKRFQSAAELIETLDPEGKIVSVIIPGKRVISKKKKFAITLFLISFLFLLYLYFGKYVYFIKPVKTHERISILVIPFRGGPGEKEKYLAHLVTSKIIEALGNSRDVWVISVPIGGKFTKEYLENKILKKKITYIIDGNLLLLDNSVRVSAKITDNRNSVIVWSNTIEEKKENIYKIPSKVASAISKVANVYVSVEKLKFRFPNKELFEYYTTGLLLARKEKTLDAISEYKECLKLYDKFVPAYVALSAEYLRRSDQGSSYSLESLSKCKYYLDRGLKLDGKNLKLLNILGWYFYFTYDLKRCYEICKKIISINPEFSFVHATFAWVNLCLGKVDEFFIEEKKYEHLRPLDWQAYLNDVVIGAMVGRGDKVSEGIKKLHDVYALSFVINTADGWYYIYHGKFKKARSIFKKGYDDTMDPILKLAIAECDFAMGDYEDAAKNLRWWIKNNPYSLKAYWLLCVSFLAEKKEKELKEVAKKGFLRAKEMYGKFKNPAILMYMKYFATISRAEKVDIRDVESINLNGYGTFERFLKVITLMRLGKKVKMDFIPYDPKYWITRFYKVELKIVENGSGKVLK